MKIIELEDKGFFLRDDCERYKDDPNYAENEKECYSLCKRKDHGYHREMVFRGPLEWAIQQSKTYMNGYRAAKDNLKEKIKELPRYDNYWCGQFHEFREKENGDYLRFDHLEGILD